MKELIVSSFFAFRCFQTPHLCAGCEVMNSSVLQSVHPQSLLSWQRVRVAHVLAETGKQWCLARF
eukprot:1613774-Amphidinium_carterae.1